MEPSWEFLPRLLAFDGYPEIWTAHAKGKRPLVVNVFTCNESKQPSLSHEPLCHKAHATDLVSLCRGMHLDCSDPNLI